MSERIAGDLNYETEEERAALSHERMEVYNKIQMAIAGHQTQPSINAIMEALAVQIAFVNRANRDNTHRMIDDIVPMMKRMADNSLDLVKDAIVNQARISSAGRS